MVTRNLVCLWAAVLACLLAGCASGPQAAPETNPAGRPTPHAAADPAAILSPDPAHRREATTPVPRNDGLFVNRHRQYVERARRGGVDVLFLGDSIVDEWRSTGKRVWEQELAPLGAVNFGLSADQTQFLLWRLADGELDGIRPKGVVLMIGTNNLKSGPTRMAPEDTVAGVEAVLRLIRERLPETQVLLLGILHRQPKYPWMAATVRKTNRLLAELGAGRPHVRFLDFSDRFLRPDGSIDPALMRADLLHLSERGYEVWADAIRGPLRDMLREAGQEAPGAAPE